MKRIFFLVAIVLTTVLTSCTDESSELEERIEFKKEVKLIDKDDVETPTTKG